MRTVNDFECCNPVFSAFSEKKEIPYPFIGSEVSDEIKIQEIENHFRHILVALGMDVADDSLEKTPHRYAKMLVRELFPGLDKENFPKITTQENKFHYDHPLIESNISIQSVCEHHFVPILGFCHIAYIPHTQVIGLSKLNRLAEHFARRPQVQERLTKQISTTLSQILNTPDVAVVIDAMHLCVRMRGIKDNNALTRTIDLNGAFLSDPIRREFFESIPKLSEMKL